jgi:hypothetical protein
LIAPLGKLIDWSFIEVRTLPWEVQIRLEKKRLAKTKMAEENPLLEDALQFLNSSNFLPTGCEPAQVEFHPDESGQDFRFTPPRPSPCAENNTVHGRLYRCGKNWRERPAGSERGGEL